MYHSIVVPLDGSPFSEYALPTARSIARHAGATLRLTHVHVPVEGVATDTGPLVDFHVDVESRQHERSHLDKLQEQLTRESELPVAVTLLDGSVANALAEEINVSDADLVVMTTHGRGGLTRLWLGSVADRLLHHVEVPLLLLRPPTLTPQSEPHPGFRHIMIPLDGSHLAEQTLGPVLALDPARAAEYTLLQVVHPFVTLDYLGAAPVPDLDYDMTMQRQRVAQAYLASVAERLRADGRRVHIDIVIEERPAVVVLQLAQERQADLIALATHGRGGPSRLLIGSVADKVIRGAECPVLVFRPTSSEDVVH